MPYQRKNELPKGVKDNLPSGAQEIYMKAYDSALKQYRDPSKRRGKESQEQTAAKVAWAAVKKKYTKSGGEWHQKRSAGTRSSGRSKSGSQ